MTVVARKAQGPEVEALRPDRGQAFGLPESGEQTLDRESPCVRSVANAPTRSWSSATAGSSSVRSATPTPAPSASCSRTRGCTTNWRSGTAASSPPRRRTATRRSKTTTRSKAPLLAVIDLTNRCNLGCPVCFAEVPNGQIYYLDIETVRRMLQALVDRRPLPCRHVQFSGGEPTLHPQFLDIVRMAPRDGIQPRPGRDQRQHVRQPGLHAQRCEEAGLHTLYLQFDGMDDRVYVALRGQPSARAEAARGREPHALGHAHGAGADHRSPA